jgi:hypothetical protein
MKSTFAAASCLKNCRECNDRLWKYCRWPSAARVSIASEDLPLPLGPVNTTSWSRGIVKSIFFRLCVFAPTIRIRSDFSMNRESKIYGSNSERSIYPVTSINKPGKHREFHPGNQNPSSFFAHSLMKSERDV